ncbi:MAG: porin [Arcobacteraceae bacterium]
MKKIVKMSLVAAVAVAGLTTANAKPLEEAIKDVEVSGSVVYRYNDVNTKDGKSRTDNNYKIGLNVSSKINDDVKLNTRFLVGENSQANGFFNSDTTDQSDGDAGVSLTNVYFSYTGIANTTVNVGKQGLTTPWTQAQQIDGNEQTGTGILALTTVGPVTLAGAYFNQTNLNESGSLHTALNGMAASGNVGANDIWTAGVMANVGPVALDAWYLSLDEIFKTYTLGAKANLDLDAVKLGAALRYTALKFDSDTALGANSDTNNHNMVNAVLTAKAGIVDAKYAFARTGKEGGIIALDNDAATTMQGWSVRADGEAKSTYHQFVVGVQAMDSVHVSANYVTKKYNEVTGVDANKEKDTEIYAQLTYKMSSNLTSYVRFGQGELKTDSTNTKTETDYKGRLQIAYTF